MKVPSSAHRVAENTADDINERIARRTERDITYYSHHPQAIEQRLRELDEEWDIERVLETNAAAFALTGTLLGIAVDRRWLALPALVTGFLLQHGVQGWCPPVPLFRRLGVRTPQEIEAERYALKAIRGDFRAISTGPKGAEPAARATGRLLGSRRGPRGPNNHPVRPATT